MDDRAYHLQTKARLAVQKGLHDGTLTREPCKVCGGIAQAHHGLQTPTNRDGSRLCPAHHRQWHCDHEPEWPTIYEFHPSDEPVHRPPRHIHWPHRTSTQALVPKVHEAPVCLRQRQADQPWFRPRRSIGQAQHHHREQLAANDCTNLCTESVPFHGMSSKTWKRKPLRSRKTQAATLLRNYDFRLSGQGRD